MKNYNNPSYVLSLPYEEGLEILQEGIREQSKNELYELWLKRFVNPIQENKEFIEWDKFLDKHLNKNKSSVPTEVKTDEEAIAHANEVIEMFKRSRQ